jgi:hypothetical protein
LGGSFQTVGTWTAAGTIFDFTSPTTGAGAGALDGNAAANRIAGLGGTINATWAAGETLWIRFVERNDTGNDHGLAVDNFSLSAQAVPEPATFGMLTLGMLGIGGARRRRRQSMTSQ